MYFGKLNSKIAQTIKVFMRLSVMSQMPS